MKNNEAISELNQAMEKARADLYKAIEIYGRSSKEVVIASQKLDEVIVIAYKEQLNINKE
ncbi:Spo0E like sporulation regulatory protein [Clostridium puniceum]|uniref:Spo0E like sporulation regulatory protein n=1 Tax=Clostridium puniceum TaxID=29367 RepID=A0A1S8TC73_9CLOT|nr:aspartyl-phosphate phosphatase Spo0E family protein [Clostridium puniceum]OOM75427.1 Spo0E like sporulation regulatory protein [Clostridium puniceum]